MNPRPLIAVAFAVLNAAAQAADPVTASFERMLTHPPHHAAVPHAAQPADALTDAIVAALRRPHAAAVSIARVAAAAGPDPALASFERLLQHQPGVAMPPVPPTVTDPLVAAVVEPLSADNLAACSAGLTLARR